MMFWKKWIQENKKKFCFKKFCVIRTILKISIKKNYLFTYINKFHALIRKIKIKLKLKIGDEIKIL